MHVGFFQKNNKICCTMIRDARVIGLKGLSHIMLTWKFTFRQWFEGSFASRDCTFYSFYIVVQEL